MHQYSIEEVVNILKTDVESGISEQEAVDRLEKYGPNTISAPNTKSLLSIFISQFKSPIVFLLLFAIGISSFFRDWLDAIAILVVLFINSIIGFFMEFQAHRSMQALRNLSTSKAKIIRGNYLKEVPSDEIVPGDLLYIEAGDMVPADARIIKFYDLQVDESTLTGESIPVEKSSKVLEETLLLPERENMLYKGTIITRGNSKAIVTGTGMKTELGKIASLVQEAGSSATPIEKKLDEFSKKLIKITVALVVLIFIVGIANGHQILNMLQTSIALAVAAIPEGLPIVATLALGQGMLKMASQYVVVKKLAAVETLGGTNIICTDKTGTLTQNKIEVGLLIGPDYSTNNFNAPSHDSFSYKMTLNGFVLCNNGTISEDGNLLIESGDPLETGLLKFARRCGIDINKRKEEFPRLSEEPFSSETKIMATLHKNGDHGIVFSKGAIEELLKRCSYILDNETIVPFLEEDKIKWIKKGEELALSGLRVLAFAFKDGKIVEKIFSEELVFTGIAGLLDPISDGVKEAIEECQSAGIKVVMITGDHPNTAKNIGLQLGLINSNDGGVIHGKDMSDLEDLSAVERANWKANCIFARVSPKQKLDLVTVLQEDNNIVAMTGDGINDTPALKKADIGIAMGRRGTQAAQEVAVMILKDDSFSSIVVAIRQGRIIFSNIRMFVIFLLSCNLSEIFIIAISAILNLPFQLLPLQILFINIITDVLPALALGISPGDKGIMDRLPRNPESPILNNKHWKSIFIYSSVISIFSIAAVFYSYFKINKSEQVGLGNNILFFTLIFSQLLHVFNMTNRKESFMNTGIYRNKYVWYALGMCIVVTVLTYHIGPLKEALGLHLMTLQDWSVILIFSILSLCCIQLLKKINIVL